MTHRPWRLEYLDAESTWRIDSTYATEEHARAAAEQKERDNPGVTYRVADNVHFEAHKEDV